MALRLLVLLLALVIGIAGCTTTAPTRANGSALVADSGPLEGVAKRTFTAYGFRLQSGRVLPEMTLAYETYGRLAPDGRNAILITHGFTSSGHAAGKYSPADRSPGWWDGLIGPGKAIDTNRYFVVSSNMLGSSYGSTGPSSVNPATGKPYGPDFPAITVRDIVEAQRLLLSALGVSHLVAVAGPSYGGFQAFQWAVTHPDFMSGIVAVVSQPRARADLEPVASMVGRFAQDPNWNGGWHYDRGRILATLTEVRYETLMRYGANEMLAVTIPERTEREARIRQMAEAWAREFDPNSMVTLRRALDGYNTEPQLPAVRAKVLYVLSRTDKLFPPSIAPDVMDKLARAGVDARYFEIDSEFGHSASGPEWAKWGPTLKAFVDSLAR
jgi:homoserine O-acetyltransferase